MCPRHNIINQQRDARPSSSKSLNKSVNFYRALLRKLDVRALPNSLYVGRELSELHILLSAMSDSLTEYSE